MLSKCLKVAEPVRPRRISCLSVCSLSILLMGLHLPFLSGGALRTGWEKTCLRLPEFWATDPGQILPQCHTAYVHSASWSGGPQTPGPCAQVLACCLQGSSIQGSALSPWSFPSPLTPLQSPKVLAPGSQIQCKQNLLRKVILPSGPEATAVQPVKPENHRHSLLPEGCG